MSFDGTEGAVITYSDAHDLTEAFQSNNANHIKAVFFGKDKIEDILEQTGCEGIRIYYAQDSSGSPTLVMVGADSNEVDLINGDIVDNGVHCPPLCGPANDLNNN